MALATYNDLLAAVPKFLFNRADLTALIPDWVTLAQTRINIDLSVASAEVELPLVAVVNSRFIDISTIALNEPRGLWLTTYSPRLQIEYVLPEDMTVSTAAGEPTYWTIDGTNIAFNRPAAVANPFTFRLIQNWALSASSPTNYLMSNYPSVYLYATLCEAAPYLGNDALVAKWEAKYKAAVDGAKRNLGRFRSALVSMRSDLALQQRRPIFNITSGLPN